MANEKNLKNGEATQFRTGEKQVEIARQGGIASGKARREKKTVQKILTDYLESSVSDNALMSRLASEMKLDTDKSIKELVVFRYLFNSVKKGGLDNMAMLGELIGEEKPKEDTAETEQILAVIKECAYEDRNK